MDAQRHADARTELMVAGSGQFGGLAEEMIARGVV